MAGWLLSNKRNTRSHIIRGARAGDNVSKCIRSTEIGAQSPESGSQHKSRLNTVFLYYQLIKYELYEQIKAQTLACTSVCVPRKTISAGIQNKKKVENNITDTGCCKKKDEYQNMLKNYKLLMQGC